MSDDAKLTEGLSMLPKFDWVGPTVDDDIRRAITRYGMDEVKAAIQRLGKSKKGRRRIPDWKELRSVIEEDARLWLQERNPFTERTDYAIAKAYTDDNPGYNHAATMQRIERKLRSKVHGRKWFVLVTAYELSRAEYSYKRHVDALKALTILSPSEGWETSLDLVQSKVADFERGNGPPPDGLTMAQIEEGARPPNALLNLPKRVGLFGAAARKDLGT